MHASPSTNESLDVSSGENQYKLYVAKGRLACFAELMVSHVHII